MDISSWTDYKQREAFGSSQMKSRFRTAGFLVAFALIATYGVFALRGGIPALLNKQQEISRLQQQNANLAREIEYKRQRIERLKHSTAEQQREIRRQFKLQRPGETTFILPEEPAKK